MVVGRTCRFEWRQASPHRLGKISVLGAVVFTRPPDRHSDLARSARHLGSRPRLMPTANRLSWQHSAWRRCATTPRQPFVDRQSGSKGPRDPSHLPVEQYFLRGTLRSTNLPELPPGTQATRRLYSSL